jgi:predicted nucleic acid-binding protein
LIFLDTSVLIAIAQVDHVHHVRSRELWNGCQAKETAVSAHTLAEFYSSVTSMPPGIRVSGRNAMLALETFLGRVTPIALTSAEYVETLKSCAAKGLTGGTIYDALHVACTRKVDPEWIYTWNLRHFQRAAPDLAERILEP